MNPGDAQASKQVTRSPWLMTAQDTALLIVDLQARLMPLIGNPAIIEWNCTRLVDAAKILGITTWATEQYPQGLGSSVDSIVERFSDRPSKTMFSCRECIEELMSQVSVTPRKILLAGIETHVCVQQTALDLLSMGFDVYVAVDAVGSRHSVDHEFGLRRMESMGATLTTTEAAMFEWCEIAGSPEFKQVSQLVRLEAPAS